MFDDYIDKNAYNFNQCNIGVHTVRSDYMPHKFNIGDIVTVCHTFGQDFIPLKIEYESMQAVIRSYEYNIFNKAPMYLLTFIDVLKYRGFSSITPFVNYYRWNEYELIPFTKDYYDL